MRPAYDSSVLGMVLALDRAKDEKEVTRENAKISVELIGDDFEEIVKHSKIIFNKDTTILITPEGDKTICRPSHHEVFDKETGIAMCIVKYLFGSRRKWLQFVEGAKDQTPDYSDR